MRRAGEELGGYRIARWLGSGGMGAVYEALDADDRHVALKLLHPHIGADPVARDRLRREVETLQRVRHPFVARVLDAEADSDEAFVVTELVVGESLDERVRRDGPLAPDDVVRLGRGLLDALTAIHAAGVVHRDVKPANVMLTHHGPVLIDFGISQIVDAERFTATGQVTGTPGYLDPALATGSAPPGPAADLWSWAAVLLFASTGRPPFGRGTYAVVLGRAALAEADVDGLPDDHARALRAALRPSGQRLAPRHLLGVLAGDPAGQAALDLLEGRAAVTDVLRVDRTPGAHARSPGDQREGVAQPAPATAPVPPPPAASPPPPRPTVLLPAPTTQYQSGAAPTAQPGSAPTAPYRPPAARPAQPPPPMASPWGGWTQVGGPGPAPWPAQASPVRHGPQPGDAQPPGDGHQLGPGQAPGYGYQSGPGQAPWQPAPPGAWAGQARPLFPAAPFPSPASGPPAPPRPVLMLVLWLVATALAASWPGPTAISLGILLLLGGAVGSGARMLRVRRSRRGRRSSDRAWAWLLAPVHLVRAAVVLALAVGLGAVIAVPLWLIGSAVVTSAALGLSVDRLVLEAVVTAASAGVGLLVIWLAPWTGMVREGAREILATAVPHGVASAAVVVAGIVVTSVAAGLALTGVTTAIWDPFPPPPW